ALARPLWCSPLHGYRSPCQSGAPCASKPCPPHFKVVIPAKAGIQGGKLLRRRPWPPALRGGDDNNVALTLGLPVVAGEPRAGVGGIVDREQTRGFDRCVALGRGQAGVTQQLLDRAQIAAGAQQVGRKAMPQ